jgi:DNA polymerase III sliding clamp (beta) subunit (PCNA family)
MFQFTLKTKDLKALFDATKKTLGTPDNPVLQSIYMKVQDGRCAAMSCNGYAASQIVVDCDVDPAYEGKECEAYVFPFTLPQNGILYCTITVEQNYSESNASVSFDFLDTMYTQRFPKQWKYPDIYKQFPSEEPERTVYVNSKLLINALTSCKSDCVAIELRGGLKPFVLSSDKEERFIVLPIQSRAKEKREFAILRRIFK